MEAPPSSTPSPTKALPAEAKLNAETIRNLLAQGELREGITQAYALAEQHPESVEAGLILASAYTLAERYADAIRSTERVLSMDPNVVGAWVTQGAALRGLGRTEEAMASTLQALTLDADNPGALSNLARLYGDQRLLEQQEEILNKLVKIAPEDADARLALSQNKGQQGDLQGALNNAVKASKVDPRHLESHVYQAVTLFSLKRYHQAMEHAEVALRIDSEEPVALEIFRNSYYLSMAIRLTCKHGAGPWSRQQIREQINKGDFPLKALPGVLEFETLQQEFAVRTSSQKRIAEAATACGAQSKE